MPQSRAFFEIFRVRMHCRGDTEACPYTAVKSEDMICLQFFRVTLNIKYHKLTIYHTSYQNTGNIFQAQNSEIFKQIF